MSDKERMMTDEERIDLIVIALTHVEEAIKPGSMGRLSKLETIMATLQDDLRHRLVARVPADLQGFLEVAAALAYEKWRADAGNSIDWEHAATDVKENWRKKVLRDMQDRK